MYDGRVVTLAAREAFDAKFRDEVDPSGELRLQDPVEAERRAQAARKLHFARLALASVKARTKKIAAASTTAAISEEVRSASSASAAV